MKRPGNARRFFRWVGHLILRYYVPEQNSVSAASRPPPQCPKPRSCPCTSQVSHSSTCGHHEISYLPSGTNRPLKSFFFLSAEGAKGDHAETQRNWMSRNRLMRLWGSRAANLAAEYAAIHQRQSNHGEAAKVAKRPEHHCPDFETSGARGPERPRRGQ